MDPRHSFDLHGKRWRWMTGVAWFGIAMASFYLIIHAYLGTYSRYIADDFCTVADVLRFGFWGAQLNIYLNWSGRFAFNFLIALSHLVGPGITPILPTLAVVSWLAALVFIFMQMILHMTKQHSPAGSILPAALILCVVISASPNIYQSLYWQTGMLTYVFPLILATAYAGWLLQVSRNQDQFRLRIFHYLIGFLGPFIMGGFSETYVSVQTAGFAFVIATTLLARERARIKNVRTLLLMGLLGSVVAFIVVVLAPGNAVRRGLMPVSPDLFTLIKVTWSDWYIFSVRTLKWHPLGLSLSFLIPLFTGLLTSTVWGESSQQRTVIRIPLWFVSIPVATFLLMCASIAPYEYAISSFPDARVLVTTLFVLILGIGSWSYLLGVWFSLRFERFNQRLIRLGPALSMVFLVAFAIFTWDATRMAFEERDEMRDFAAAWDIRDGKLRDASIQGTDVIEAASLPHMGGGLAEIGYDPNEWINRCIAQTYGFDQVIAK